MFLPFPISAMGMVLGMGEIAKVVYALQKEREVGLRERYPKLLEKGIYSGFAFLYMQRQHITTSTRFRPTPNPRDLVPCN